MDSYCTPVMEENYNQVTSKIVTGIRPLTVVCLNKAQANREHVSAGTGRRKDYTLH